MFEGWATELLASYLGKLLDIQQEQLKVNLWTAWKTGVTLEDVPLKKDAALDQFGTVPFALVGGAIGKVQVSVPWGALMAPVVVSLSDVEIVVRVLDDDELSGEKAYERYIDFKKGLLASQQLKAVAREVDKTARDDSIVFGGVMVSFVKHALSLLLRRLRIDIRNVRITLVDGEEESAPLCTFSVGQIHSVDTPLEFRLNTKDTYRIPGRKDTIIDLADRSLKQGASKNFRFCGVTVMWGTQTCLMETDFNAKVLYDIKSSPSQILFALEFDTFKTYLNTDDAQEMVRLMEDIEWKSVRLQVGHLKSDDSLDALGRWKFAVDSILLKLHGPLKFSRWKSPKDRLQERRRYILLYRKKMEREVMAKGERADVGSSQSLSLVGENQLAMLEESMSVSDILACRTTAKKSLEHNVTHQRASSKIKNYEFLDTLGTEDTTDSCWVKIPTLADMDELFRAVDFSPEEVEASTGLSIQALLMLHMPLAEIQVCNTSDTMSMSLSFSNIACGFVNALEGVSYGMGSLEHVSWNSSKGSFANPTVIESVPFLQLEYSSLTKCIQADVTGIQIHAVSEDVKNIVQSIPLQSPEAYSLQWMKSALSMEKIGYCIETVQRIKSLGNFIDFAIRLGETCVDVHDMRLSLSSLSLGTLMESKHFDELHRVYNVISSLTPQEGSSRVVQDAMQSLEDRLIYKELDIRVERLAIRHDDFSVLHPVNFSMSMKINRLLGDFSHPQVVLGLAFDSLALRANDQVVRTAMDIHNELTGGTQVVDREHDMDEILNIRVDWSSIQIGWVDGMHEQVSMMTQAGMLSLQTSTSSCMTHANMSGIEIQGWKGMEGIDISVINLHIPYIAKALHIGYFAFADERTKHSRSLKAKIFDFSVSGDSNDPSNFIKMTEAGDKSSGVEMTFSENSHGIDSIDVAISNIDIGHGTILRASILPLILDSGSKSVPALACDSNISDKDRSISLSMCIRNVHVTFVHDANGIFPRMPIEYLDFSSVQPRIASCTIKRLMLDMSLSEKASVKAFEMEALKLCCGVLGSKGPTLAPILVVPMVLYDTYDAKLVMNCKQVEIGIHPYQLTLLRAIGSRWNFQKQVLTQKCIPNVERLHPNTEAPVPPQRMDFDPVKVCIQDVGVSFLGLPALNGGLFLLGRSFTVTVAPKFFSIGWESVELHFRESEGISADSRHSESNYSSGSNTSPSNHSSDYSRIDNDTEFYDVSRGASSASFMSKYYSIETVSSTSNASMEESNSILTLSNDSLISVLSVAFDIGKQGSESQGVTATFWGKNAKISLSPLRVTCCVDPIPSMVQFIHTYANYLAAHASPREEHADTLWLPNNAPIFRDLEVEFQCISIIAETRRSREFLEERLSFPINSIKEPTDCSSGMTDFVSLKLQRCLCSYSSGNAGQKISLQIRGLLLSGDSYSEVFIENLESGAFVGIRNVNLQCSILNKKGEAQAFKSDISCDQMTAWVTQKNISPVKHVLVKLRDCIQEARVASSTDSESQTTESWSSGTVNSTIMMSLGRLSFVLSSSVPDGQVYLMEGNMDEVSVMAYVINGVAHGSASCSIGVAVPTAQHRAWANLLDDTDVKCQVVSPHLGHASSPSPSSNMAHVDLDVGPANLTVNSEIFRSISLCQVYVNSLIASTSSIDLRAFMGMDWVVNQTEFDLLLCFTVDIGEHGGDHAILLEPGARFYPGQMSMHPHKSGFPCPKTGVSEGGECYGLPVQSSRDSVYVKLPGSDGRFGKIHLQRESCLHYEFIVEGHHLSLTSKTTRQPSGSWRTSLEPSVEFWNNTSFRISLACLLDSNPGHQLISTVHQHARIWLPLFAASGEYRFKIDCVLDATESYKDEFPIGWSRAVFLRESMFETGFLDHVDVISDHGATQSCVSLTIKGLSGSVFLVASPKVEFHNLLPVPMAVISGNACFKQDTPPTERLMLADIHNFPWNFKISPLGFHESSSISLSAEAGMSKIGCGENSEPDSSVLSMTFSSNSSGSTELFAQIMAHKDIDTGTISLKILTPVWVYNYTGLPISLSCLLSPDMKNAIDKWEEADDAEIMDIVPESWILPIQISIQNELISVRSVPSSLHISLSEPSLCETDMGENLPLTRISSRQAACPEHNISEPSNEVSLGLGCLTHEAETLHDATLIYCSHGQVDGVDSPGDRKKKAHSVWPSGLNQNATSMLKQPVKRFRVRTSRQKARSGSTFWSSPLVLDDHHMHELVPIPSPVTGIVSKDAPRPGEYPTVVSFETLENGVEEIVIAPQFVIINQLRHSIQYRQKDTNAEVKVKPGEFSPLQWTDSGLPRKLSVRIFEAGWSWSGGFSLDNAGDIFLKLRHRDRGVTRIVRADVSHSLKDGTRRIIFRSNPEEFTPYRIENCSLETLTIRQKGVTDQQDVLRPYCSLDYTWDEPSLPHSVVIERPGGIFLGSIDLDQVGLRCQVNFKDKLSDERIRLDISVHSEGPMRVLVVMDEKYHESMSPDGRDPSNWNGSLNNIFHLKCALSSISISYVHKKEEKLLLAIKYFALSCLMSPSRISITGSIDLLQLDNPRFTSVYPVVLLLPAPESTLTSRVRNGIEPQTIKKPVAWKLILWRKKPETRIVCFELAEMHLRSIGIYIEQDILNLFEEISRDVESLKDLKVAPSIGPQASSGQMSFLDLSALDNLQQGQYSSEKYYFDRLIISPVEMRLSFNSSLVQDSSRPFLQQVIALADIEDARLWLAGVVLKNALLDEITMESFLTSHYRRALLLELFKIVGAANVLGDPMALLHHVGLGVWEFFSGPAVGLIESAKTFGPREFIFGLISGTKGLFQNILFATSNATTKASSAAHKAILVWGFGRHGSESNTLMDSAVQHWLQVDHDSADDEGLIGAVLRGIIGLATDPIKGAEERGLTGFVDGLCHGLLGSVLIPMSAWLQMCASTASSIRRAVAGTANISWFRPPRWIDSSNALKPYNWTESMGRWLFAQLSHLKNRSKKIENDSFVLCCRIQDAEGVDETYLLLTDRRVLVVMATGNNWNPRVLWASRLAAIETIHTDQKSLTIVSNPDLVKSSMLKMHEDCGKPFSVCVARLETEEDSQRFSARLTDEYSRHTPNYYRNRIKFNI